MMALKRLVRVLLQSIERLFDFAFGQKLNPFAWLGSLGWFLFWIVAASGIYLYIFLRYRYHQRLRIC